jgi:hypothetical protein
MVNAIVTSPLRVVVVRLPDTLRVGLSDAKSFEQLLADQSQ